MQQPYKACPNTKAMADNLSCCPPCNSRQCLHPYTRARLSSSLGSPAKHTHARTHKVRADGPPNPAQARCLRSQRPMPNPCTVHVACPADQDIRMHRCQCPPCPTCDSCTQPRCGCEASGILSIPSPPRSNEQLLESMVPRHAVPMHPRHACMGIQKADPDPLPIPSGVPRAQATPQPTSCRWCC
jgi:hypothetical protein